MSTRLSSDSPASSDWSGLEYFDRVHVKTKTKNVFLRLNLLQCYFIAFHGIFKAISGKEIMQAISLSCLHYLLSEYCCEKLHTTNYPLIETFETNNNISWPSSVGYINYGLLVSVTDQSGRRHICESPMCHRQKRIGHL